ncbi:hypothetical protein [Chryseobacterium elymi]|nr:hypothetical protein [Chryseobacterium elymi]
MKRKIYLYLLVLFLPLSCNGQTKGLISKGDYLVAIDNAVSDFSKTSSLLKKDTFFSVSYKVKTNIIEVNIIGNSNKFYIDNDKPLNRLPTNYIESNGKIFYWFDDNQNNSNPNIINKLKEYKLIEYNAETIEYSRDDKKKGVSYYFCKNDLTNYKKVKSNISQDITLKVSCK